MQRGEVWTYSPTGIPRVRRILIVSSDGINDSPRAWLLGLEVLDEDPDDLLAVQLTGNQWAHTGSISRVYRGWFTDRLDRLDPELLERVDAGLRAALDL